MPDLPGCDCLVIIGGNPLVSNGSLIWAPRIAHDLDAIARRGRVVIVDPGRSEAAARYEHLTIRPNRDVWLLIGSTEILLDDVLRLVPRTRAAAFEFRAPIWPGLPHCWPLFDFLQEADAAMHEVAAHFQEHWTSQSRRRAA